MAFQNRPAVNEPDLLRPSPDVVNQAYVVLALRKHYQRGLSQGFLIGLILGVIGALVGITISHVLRS